MPEVRMATVRTRATTGRELREAAAAAPAAPAQGPAEAETYSWQRTSVPLTRAMSARDRVQTTGALCGVIGVFVAVVLLVGVLGLLRLHGGERVSGALLCLVVATMLGALIGYLVLTPLDPDRGPRAGRLR